MEDSMSSEGGIRQRFIVTIDWTAESDGRLTEGDVHEAIEQMVLEQDEDAVVDVAETIDTSD